MKNNISCILVFIFGCVGYLQAQFSPKNITKDLDKKAVKYADSLYAKLSMDERIGQLYIVALYTNKDQNHISGVRKLVEQ